MLFYSHWENFVTCQEKVKICTVAIPDLELGTNHCGKMHKEAFKARQDKKDAITRCDYAERLTEKCQLNFNVNILVATEAYSYKVLHCSILTLE